MLKPDKTKHITNLRINTGWIVGTSVQENDRLFGNLGNVLQSTGKVKATGLWVVVAVLLHVEARSLKERHMVAPGGRRLVNVLRALVKVPQKVGANGERSRAGDALHGGVLKLDVRKKLCTN